MRIERTSLEEVMDVVESLDVYGDETFWDDDGLYKAVDENGNVVGLLILDEESSIPYVAQMEVVAEKEEGVGSRILEEVFEKTGADAVSGIAVCAAVPFWSRVGAQFTDGGTLDTMKVLKASREGDEDFFDENWEEGAAFLLRKEDFEAYLDLKRMDRE